MNNKILPKLITIIYLRKRVNDKRICVILSIEISLNKIEDTIVSECAPFNVNDHLELKKPLNSSSSANYEKTKMCFLFFMVILW